MTICDEKDNRDLKIKINSFFHTKSGLSPQKIEQTNGIYESDEMGSNITID